MVQLINTIRAETVVIENHGRPVVMVMVEYERLRELNSSGAVPSGQQKEKR